ncbi:hypothetical protein [Nocardioides sp. NPDC047086]|uniref:hypothetical protein n=1 Tax=Nocardioides sp. NPDC047086 TaxID=3154810 RepID=UPI00340341D1
MSEAGSGTGGLFELTVEGDLGPVLRCALQPAVAERRPCTIFRATAGAGAGVAELVGVLDAEGLTIDDIRVSGTSARHTGAR